MKNDRGVRLRTILVTGGAGFIGSALCRHLVLAGHRLINIDKLSYAADMSRLEAISEHPNYRFEQCDIADGEKICRLLQEEQIDTVVHLAAETHVDRSIISPVEFIETNTLGTFRLLETVHTYWKKLDDRSKRGFLFHHVSTDEVFGDAENNRDASASAVFNRPSSPYSASKAAAEHLAWAWYRTYGLPVIISNSSNTFGPGQSPDKLIPLVVVNALREQSLPVYGTGEYLRSWLYVDDHVRGLDLLLKHGRAGEAYHFCAPDMRTSICVVRAICSLLNQKRPRAAGRPYEELIEFVSDRPGHDRRYVLNSQTAREQLNWRPLETFEAGLEKTVNWYLAKETSGSPFSS